MRQNNFKHRVSPKLQASNRALTGPFCLSPVPAPLCWQVPRRALKGHHASDVQEKALVVSGSLPNLQRKGLEKGLRFRVRDKPDRKQLAAMLGLTDAPRQARSGPPHSPSVGQQLSGLARDPPPGLTLLLRWKH